MRRDFKGLNKDQKKFYELYGGIPSSVELQQFKKHYVESVRVTESADEDEQTGKRWNNKKLYELSRKRKL